MLKHRFTHIVNRFLILAAASLFACMASCSDEDINSPAASRRISFEVTATESWSRAASADDNCATGVSLSALVLKGGNRALYLIPEVTRGIGGAECDSRSEAVTKETIADFGVYASTGSDEVKYYMDNVEVAKANSWAPRKEYLWPGSGTLHINAYSPYCSAPDTESGITSLADGNASSTPKLAYTVPADAAEQLDLMWATPRDASASPCALEFNHALAAVRFVAGAEMTPCTVKSITISGLIGSGTLDLETGDWTDTAGSESYTATVDAALAASSGQDYAAEGTEITDASHTFMLMPQTLADDAAVAMVIEYGGTEMEFTAKLGGQIWAAGNTYTYHLSANPATDRFVITVDSPISFNYTGGTGSFAVKSIHETLRGGELTTSDVPWIAEFVDENGNAISTPSWITAMAMAGDGSGDYSASTQMVEPSFVQMSEPTRLLRQQPEAGSAAAPYNLANSSGASPVENTANCYVINAPGIYSIPLVYGNAIKNGTDNTAAYAPTRSSAPFVNHLGNRIKHPYIYDNEGCANPASAVLVWEGRLNMIHNLRLSDDGKSLVFEIPRAYIRQGNAVVAVADADGNIMWSWQLWVTDYVPGDDMSTLSYNGSSFEMMPYNMGYVVGGDETDFASSTALVRFTQKPANGTQGNSVVVKVEQRGKHIITPDCYSFYQWGRKDPMISAIKEWYYADHTEITSIDVRPAPTSSNKIEADFDALCVKNPQVFWVAGNEPAFRYTNNWNLGTSTRRVKTVYDPCPAGFMVPGNEMMALRDLDESKYSYTSSGGIADPAGFHVACESGPDLFFPALGYRSGNSGHETISDASGGNLAALWTSHATQKEGNALILNNDNETVHHPLRSDPRLEGFAIRPIRE